MRLSWSSSKDIAERLFRDYPDLDRSSLSRPALLEMICALKDFDDAPSPPKPTYLDHILWTWMRLADMPPPARQEG